MKYVDKRYIYVRENENCFHCGKKLGIGKVTLDHYFPKSSGGTYDVFNLVCSCKKCNKYKKSIIPKDCMEVQVKLFVMAVEDKRIVPIHSLNNNYKEILDLTKEVYSSKAIDNYTIFESPNYKFYVRENKIFRLEKKC